MERQPATTELPTDRSLNFDVTKPACEFVPIPTQQEYDANYFINDQSAASDQDDE